MVVSAKKMISFSSLFEEKDKQKNKTFFNKIITQIIRLDIYFIENLYI